MFLSASIVTEVGMILDARNLDHTMTNRFAVLTELQADRFDVLVYSREYHETLMKLIARTAMDIHELV